MGKVKPPKKKVGYLAQMEREAILSALRAYGGHRTHTAEFLGITVRGLRIKLAQYELQGFEVTPSSATPR